MSVDNMIPEIQFKGLSGEWERLSFLDSIERIIDFRGRTPKKLGLDWSSSGYRALSALNVKQGYIDFLIDPHFGDQELYDKWMSGAELHKGQVLFTTEAPMGNVAQVPNTDKYILSQRTIAFIVKSEIIVEDFLAVLLRSSRVFRELSALSSGGTAKGVSQKVLANLSVSIPNDLAEQATIGNYFQKLDMLINQHQQKHDKLSSIKKAMLEKMFPKQGETIPEIRFKGFSGQWYEKELNNEVELFSGLTYSPSDIRKSGTLVLRSSNVKNGQLIEADNIYVNPEVVNCSNVVEGDIIVVVRNGSRALIGKHAQVTSCMDNTVIGAFMTGIRSKQPAFINALLDTNMFTTEVDKNLGATINQITNGSFNSMVFMFPKEDEQQEIGNYFQKFDELINQHQQQITKLNNIKQACLSKMFV